VSNCDEVLVVDEVSDTAEVLQAVIEPRGLKVTGQPSRPIPGTRLETRPAVVVLAVRIM